MLGGDCTLVAGVVAGAAAPWASPWASSTSTPTPTSTRPRRRPRATCTGWRWRSPWAAGRRRWWRRWARRPTCSPTTWRSSASAPSTPASARPLGDLGLALPALAARRLGMRVAAALALDGVGNDDGPARGPPRRGRDRPAEMPAKAVAHPRRGARLRRGRGPAHRLLASPRVVALEVCEYEPERDDAALTCGRRIVELVTRAVARRLRRLDTERPSRLVGLAS